MQSIVSMASGNSHSPNRPLISYKEQEPGCDCDIELMGNHHSQQLRRRFGQNSFRPSSIDKWSRIFFPLTFLTFHIIYWTVYLNAVEAEHTL